MKVTASVEIDEACRSVIARHFPGTAIFSDVTEVTGDQLRAAGFVPRRGILAPSRRRHGGCRQGCSVTAPETPAQFLRRAAALIRKRASEATPGPWERPLDVRGKTVVIAPLPDDEKPRTWRNGIIPADAVSRGGPTGRYAGQRERTCVVSAPSDSITGFYRKRSGRDLEYIALMHPGVGLAVADLLEDHAGSYDQMTQDFGIAAAWFAASADGGDEDKAFSLARVILGEAP